MNCKLQTIKGQAFANCPRLKEFNIQPDDDYFKFDNGVLTNKNGTAIYVYLPSSSNKYYVVPSLVTTIKPYAFQKCTHLEAIYISDGTLNQIDIFAFLQTNHMMMDKRVLTIFSALILLPVAADAASGTQIPQHEIFSGDGLTNRGV